MATIGDVASEAGVSRSTVSAVLTGRKFVSPETRARVEIALDKLQFSVNAGARALATSRTMTIGVVVRLHEAEFAPAMAAYLIGLADAARPRGYSILLLTDSDGVGACRRVIAGRQVDGLVLLNVVNDDPRLEPIVAAGFPTVLIGMPTDSRGVDAVDLDFAAGARILVDQLSEAGHREVAFVRWPDSLFLSGATFAIRFADAARARAAERGVRLVEHAVSTEPVEARQQLASVVARDDSPKALLVHHDTAAAMLPFVLNEAGLRVPQDRSVVSLHSAELAQVFALDVTSVASEPVAVAIAAVDLLVRRMGSPDSTAESRLVQPRLVNRGSVVSLES
ncbi:MAG TPA: LacI family DNA-binding transcriptional regulator [Arachnia sp.]|nr:LacI family DNA-binding transcriptional regulator [Arachnia sp.]HMT85294.1 LacI family DNA-binding transcriptional regulator [Arachnia sp.]